MTETEPWVRINYLYRDASAKMRKSWSEVRARDELQEVERLQRAGHYVTTIEQITPRP